MKLQKSDILPHLQRCALVTRDKSPSPWVRLVRLQVTDVLKLSATNYTVSVLGTVPVSDPKPIDVAVDCTELLESVQRLGDSFRAELKGEVLHLTAGERRYRIACHPTEDYPVIETPPEKAQYVLPAAPLGELLSRVRHAMDLDTTSTRNGVTFESACGKLTARATDGREAAWAEVPCDVDIGEPRPFPSPLVPMLGSLLESAQSIGVSFAASGIALSAETSAVLMRQLGHPPLPDIAKAVAQVTAGLTGVEVQRAELLEAVQCVSGTGGRGDRVELETEGEGTVRVFTRGGKREASDVVKCDGTAKGSITLATEYVASAVKAAGECIELVFTDSALVLRSESYSALIAALMGTE